MVKTAVLVSGGGTNLQALIDARTFGELPGCELAAVISSKPDAFALERARKAGIPAYVVEKSSYPDRAYFTAAIVDKLVELEIELVVYAGFNFILDSQLIEKFPNRIINIHPALIPSFCGKGFYGLHTHEAVLAHGVKITGATAHFATEIADDGPIIAQRAVPVLEGDTPKTLQQRVMEQAEWKILPEAVALFCQGRLAVEGRIVHIKEAE